MGCNFVRLNETIGQIGMSGSRTKTVRIIGEIDYSPPFSPRVTQRLSKLERFVHRVVDCLQITLLDIDFVEAHESRAKRMLHVRLYTLLCRGSSSRICIH